MPSTQELTRRIKSVKSTRKITRAMQLVSAAKMRKSQEASTVTKAFSAMSSDLIAALRSYGDLASDFTANTKGKKIAAVAISSNKGLVGSFNSNILAKLMKLKRENPQQDLQIFTLGSKIAESSKRVSLSVSGVFSKQDTTEHIKLVYPLASELINLYKSGECSKIYIVYNKFISTLEQKVEAVQLLPLDFGHFQPEKKTPAPNYAPPIVFEPSPREVAQYLARRIVEIKIFEAIIDSDASEHSARMIMMKNATESAGELIDDLTLTFNQLRQGKITTELSEITAGKLALENN